ncbi:hypothetical protein BWQ96_03431 [Gracilariopsis chorda]|uniref:Uncharacterized protein n=1 Tax=Gracilariopsis chorda TaxID=448386 RepID=A0A2V3J055_9FLOR|nr:hypothetical protein BWQ96_03431 [Gracilariopsis chorda]|eukprot:PXF46740.1 hypothetical protein BWQ96_03431 [Gracilariopsis chorda]
MNENAFLIPQLVFSNRLPVVHRKVCDTRKAVVLGTTVSPKPEPLVQEVAQRLRNDLPNLFNSKLDTHYSIYSDDVLFEDPLNKFRGVQRYKSNISFLGSSFVFSDAELRLFDLLIIGDEQNIIRTRWRLSMLVNFPWRPCISFTGQSDYVVNLSTGKVVEHIDYWDSLDDSSFFSLPAFRDFVYQTRPGVVSLNDLGGFELLKRTADFQIRKFNILNRDGVILKRRTGHTSLPSWELARKQIDNGCLLEIVAVLQLQDSLNSVQQFATSEQKLRNLVARTPFVVAGERCIYVEESVQRRPVHEVWLELVQADARVEA